MVVKQKWNFFLNLRLPDQPLMQLEPPTKKGKFSKSRVGTPGKGVAKQTKNVSHDSQSSSSSSGIQTDPQRRVCTTSSGNASNINSNTATNSSSVSQKHKSGVERVIVEQPVCNGDMRGQYVPCWDPYVMVETVSNVRLFPGNPILHSQAYMTSPVSNMSSSHCGVSGLRISNVTSLPMYSHNSLIKGENSQQSVKAKGYSKKDGIPYSHSSKEKGPQKAKMLTNKGKKDLLKKKLLGDVSSSQSSNSPDNKDVISKQKKSSKRILKTAVVSSGDSSRQNHFGESSRPHSSHQEWPTIPNLDYTSGKRFQVTFNNETVFITQYKLLK